MYPLTAKRVSLGDKLRHSDLNILRAVAQRVRATGSRIRCAHLNEYNLPVVICPDVAHFPLKSQEIFVSTLRHTDLFSFGTGLFDTRIEEIKDWRDTVQSACKGYDYCGRYR